MSIDTVYVEDAIKHHPRTQRILERLGRKVVVPIERYGEVFNRGHQSFRLQKTSPALILARKHEQLVLPAPEGYGIGSIKNYYFSHVLNCLYDCRYCFLQGMYRSAHYVVFVNYEDMQQAMLDRVDAHPDSAVYFFSGYDGDSLALDSITGFVDAFVPFASAHPNLMLELRTKSATIRPLLQRTPTPNIVAAFSFTPEPARRAYEHGVPPNDVRLSAMRRLAEHGYPLGLRFDPLLYAKDYRTHYRSLFESVFDEIEPSMLHSVSFGPFRTPRGYFRRMRKLYPEEKLFAGIIEEGPMVSYPTTVETEMRTFCEEELRRFVPDELVFPCRP